MIPVNANPDATGAQSEGPGMSIPIPDLNINQTPISEVTGPKQVTTGPFFSKQPKFPGPQDLVATAQVSGSAAGLMLPLAAMGLILLYAARSK